MGRGLLPGEPLITDPSRDKVRPAGPSATLIGQLGAELSRVLGLCPYELGQKLMREHLEQSPAAQLPVLEVLFRLM
jgi:hypothetical protein